MLLSYLDKKVVLINLALSCRLGTLDYPIFFPFQLKIQNEIYLNFYLRHKFGSLPIHFNMTGFVGFFEHFISNFKTLDANSRIFIIIFIILSKLRLMTFSNVIDN